MNVKSDGISKNINLLLFPGQKKRRGAMPTFIWTKNRTFYLYVSNSGHSMKSTKIDWYARRLPAETDYFIVLLYSRRTCIIVFLKIQQLFITRRKF